MTEGGHPEWFATCVGARRKQRNLSIQALRTAGGPTKPIVVLAESGKLRNPRPSTLAKFDTGLGWRPGSAAQVFWEGGSPVTVGRSTYKPGPGTIAVGIEPVLKLLAAQQNLHRQLDNDQSQSNQDVDGAVRQLDVAVSAIVGAFVTETLERNYGLRNTIIDSSIDSLLEQPVDPRDPDYDDKLYRRWLSGRQLNLDDATIKRFAIRLKTSRSR
ncbi:MAG: hypothetical protein WBD41_06095 [Rhodococcus sp. (in: high G+C Gram-positive bacteria)]